ncbi:MAG: TetR/AcrR family transcriptional regulator [Isosphaeraceae bacterium]
MDHASEKKTRRCSEEANLARQEEILETATELFAEHGFSDAVTQALADRLGVGKGTIYRHFPSKRDLFLAAADRVMRKMQEHVNKNIEGIDDGFERIQRAIATFLGFFADHPAFVELLIQERAYFKDRKRPTYFEHREINVQRWRQLYREMIAQGRIRDMPVEQITNVLSNVMYGIMVTNLFNGTTTPPDVQAKEILDIVFLGILSDAERRHRGMGEVSGSTTAGGPEKTHLQRSVNEIFGGANAHESSLVDALDRAGAGECGGHGVSAGAVGAGSDDPDRGL